MRVQDSSCCVSVSGLALSVTCRDGEGPAVRESSPAAPPIPWEAGTAAVTTPLVKMRLSRSAVRDKREIKIIIPLLMRRAKRSAF